MGGHVVVPPPPQAPSYACQFNEEELHWRLQLSLKMQGFVPTLGARILGVDRAADTGSIVVFYRTAEGKYGDLREPESEFPSDHLVAQLMLVL